MNNNEKNNIPVHLAIIMDGNGRWAKKRDLKRIEGHKEGVRVVKKIVKFCVRIGVKYLTLYTLSKENFKRPPKEILYLFKLFIDTLDEELSLLLDNDVRFRVVGDLDKIDNYTLSKLKNVENLTSKNSVLHLNLAISYSSRSEIVNAVKKVIKFNEKKINEKIINKYLMTNFMPDPDLLVRTGGEFRISNFLLWQIAYTELYFTKILWPDFNEKHLEEAFLNYNNRERRYGKISEQIIKK